jgi:uncharacterized protein YdiU (UPF0061 family)
MSIIYINCYFQNFQEITPEHKKSEDKRLWEQWIKNYVSRIAYDTKDFSDNLQLLQEHNEKRIKIMNENNPKYVLRNYLAKKAIERAENGDFSEVNNLLKLLETPYNESNDLDKSNHNYDQKPPLWSCKLKVSCSS